MPAGTDRVWVAITWPARPIYHATDHSVDDVTIGRGNHYGPVPGWALSRCGKLMYQLHWDEESGRFYIAGAIGIDVPFRVVNTAVVRPCRRCWR